MSANSNPHITDEASRVAQEWAKQIHLNQIAKGLRPADETDVVIDEILERNYSHRVFSKWTEGDCIRFDSYDFKIDGNDKWLCRLMNLHIFEKEWSSDELAQSLHLDIKQGKSIEEIYKKYKKNLK